MSVFPRSRRELEAELERVQMRISVRVRREDEQRADWKRQGVVVAAGDGYSLLTRGLMARADRLERDIAAMPACEADVAHMVVVDAGGC